MGVADTDPAADFMALKSKCETLLKENALLSRAVAAALKERDVLKKEVSASAGRLKDLREKLAQSEKLTRAGDFEKRLGERDALRKEVSEAQKKLAEGQKEILKRGELIDDRIKEVARLNQKISHLESTAETMQCARDAAQSRMADAKKGEAEAKARVDGLESQVAKLTKVVEALQAADRPKGNGPQAAPAEAQAEPAKA
jgi:chromosome segregation ATPase